MTAVCVGPQAEGEIVSVMLLDNPEHLRDTHQLLLQMHRLRSISRCIARSSASGGYSQVSTSWLW